MENNYMNQFNLSIIFTKQIFFFVVLCSLTLSVMAQNGIKKPQIKNIKHISTTNGGILESVPATNSITPFSWPLPSYIEAQNLFSSGNPERAIQLLQEEMSGIFPFGFSATNGYKIYFYYYKLLGDAYSKADKPVGAIDAYRLALAPVPYSTITNSPIPYAKCLYGLGKQFMEINRCGDAEDVMIGALNLSSNNFLLSDLYLCRAIRAYNAADIKQMEINAEKSINTKPDYNWKAYHYAALSHFANQDYVNAAETWLAGVNAFISGVPIEHFTEFLDISQPYWKIFDDNDIKELYDLFQSIIIVNSLSSNNCNVISRVINEKIKLEETFPEKFESEEISKKIFNNNFFIDDEFEEKNKWTRNENLAITFSTRLFKTNQYENLINSALIFEKNKNYNSALKLYERIFTSSDMRLNSDVRVENYTPVFFAIIKFVTIHEENKRTINRDRPMLRVLCEKAEKMIMKNQTENGIYTAPEYFYNFLLARVKLENELEKQIKTLHWARDIYPESSKTAYIDFIDELQQKQIKKIDDLKEIINGVDSLPLLKPRIYVYKQIEYMIQKCIKYFKKVKPKEIQDLIFEVQFNGLKKSIFDINVGEEDGVPYANSKAFNNPYKQLKIQYDNGRLTSEQNKKLFDFVRKNVLTIPATYKHINLIRKSLEEIQYFNIFKRTNDIELIILCNSSAWLNPNEIYLKLDYLPNAIKMIKINEQSNLWRTVVNVPAKIENISFNFYKTINPKLEKIDWNYKVLVRDEGDGKMEVSAFVPRDYTQELNIECDLNNSDVYDAPYLIYVNIGNSTTAADKVKMRDDGKNGDREAGDNIYSYKISILPEMLMTSYVFIYDDSEGKHQTVNNEYKVQSDKRQITNTIYKLLNNLKQ